MTDLLNDTEAVSVVTMEDIRSHESEDGHDVAEYSVGGETSESRHEKESLVERLRILRYFNW